MKLVALLKHVFVPHDKNDYKPHFFREVSVAVILFGSVFLLGASAGSSFFLHRTVLGANIAASVLIDLTNQDRLAINEAPLTRNSKLGVAAKMKGEDMSKQGYFAHTSPSGVTPWYWFREAGYDFLYAGENLAINFTESKDVENAWLDSPTHRANLLNVKFREIGIATVEGTYENNPTVFVVQMFGTPAYSASVNTLSESTSTSVSTSTPIKKKVVVTTKSESGLTPKDGSASGIKAAIGTKKSVNSTTTNELAYASGEVQGEASGTIPVLQPVIMTKDFEVVKNTSSLELPTSGVEKVETYSTWYDRVLFGGSHYVDTIYKILILIVALALVIMILVEVRKQHYKHILYGVTLLLILTVFVYINSGFF